MSSAILETDSLTRDFASVRAVDQLSLRVDRGTMFGFLGPNGAGKTTTIRLLLGLLDATSGSAMVLGHDVANESAQIRAKVGALLEHNGLYEQLTARENLEFFARVWHMKRTERAKNVREALEGMELWDRRDESVGKWSRGMRQRLALARALLHRPQLVLFDEPTAGLDVVAAAAVRAELRRMVEEEGVTVFLTTHNMHEAERLCDTIAVIKGGRLAAIDRPDRLMHAHTARTLQITASNVSEEVTSAIMDLEHVTNLTRQNGHIEIGFSGPIDAAPVVNLLVAQGVSVQEVRKSRTTLEDVFLALVNEDEDTP